MDKYVGIAKPSPKVRGKEVALPAQHEKVKTHTKYGGCAEEGRAPFLFRGSFILKAY